MFSDKMSVFDKGGNIEDIYCFQISWNFLNVAVNVPFMCYYENIYLLGTYDVIFFNQKTCLLVSQ